MGRDQMLQHSFHGKHWQGVDANINAENLVDALIASSTGHGPKVRPIRDLIQLMETHNWTVTAGLHAGGVGGSGHSADARPHITLKVLGTDEQYHLHYQTNTPRGRGLLITDIT